MKTSRIALGAVVILSFILVSLPAFSDEQAMGDTETMYTCGIDREIVKCQEKIKLKNSKSANLQREAAKALMKASFLKDHKQELIVEMKREDIGTKDYHISKFLNEKFFETLNPLLAGGHSRAVSLTGVEK